MSDWNPAMGTDGGYPQSVFDVYDQYLVPLIFQVYADEVADRLSDVRAGALLEIAAGTGAVTRTLAASLPPEVAITATDLVPGMLARAERVGAARPVTWQQADALALPYGDESFDVVVCQFGAMFFDPRGDAFAEARRVLRPGGRFVFSVWDALDANAFAAVVHAVLQECFSSDPPGFIEQLPHGYHDREVITADLRTGGFAEPVSIERIEHVARAATAVDVATAYCAGTPVRDQIQRRDPHALPGVIDAATVALAGRFGSTDLAGPISALLVTVVK